MGLPHERRHISVSWLLSTVHPAPPPTQLRFGARDLTFLGALFLHSIVERLLHGLRRDYWRSLWTRSREGKGAGWQLLRSLWEQSFFRFNAIADGSWIESTPVCAGKVHPFVPVTESPNVTRQ